jgi:hypothetical protein
METKFTPGPWSFSRWEQLGDTRFYIAQADGAPYTPNYSDVATLIAETVSGERVAVQDANARLIAAAPELLALLDECQDCIEWCAQECGHHAAAELAERIAALIAKATGEQA